MKPQILIDKNTKQILGFGYTQFKPKANEEVIQDQDIYGKDVREGIKFEDGKIVDAPEFSQIKTEKERILDELGLVENNLDEIKNPTDPKVQLQDLLKDEDIKTEIKTIPIDAKVKLMELLQDEEVQAEIKKIKESEVIP